MLAESAVPSSLACHSERLPVRRLRVRCLRMSETARRIPANSPSEVVRLERRDDDVVEVFTSLAESEIQTFDAKNIDKGQLRAGTLMDIVSLHAERI